MARHPTRTKGINWQCIPEWISEDAASRRATGHLFRRCLDIGCAYGTLALFCQRLCQCAVWCTDFIDVYLSPALRNKYGFSYAVNNIELDPFPWPLTFDLIVFTEVLEHFNFHPLPTLLKIRDLLTDDGRLYLSTPDAAEWGRVTKYYARLEDIPFPLAGAPLVDDHVYQYNKEELLGLIHQAGFRVVRQAFAPGTCGRHFNLTLAKSGRLPG
jgi:SAM-dependent methyltransferase